MFGVGSWKIYVGRLNLWIVNNNNLIFFNSNPRENDKIVLEIMIFAFGL
jgi:hypothetical protein